MAAPETREPRTAAGREIVRVRAWSGTVDAWLQEKLVEAEDEAAAAGAAGIDVDRLGDAIEAHVRTRMRPPTVFDDGDHGCTSFCADDIAAAYSQGAD